MCGIVGLAGNLAADAGPGLEGILTTAAASIAHRGPDGSGVWRAESVPLGFGHRRLAVIDLTAGGAQPMVLTDGPEVAITYNGEIYNYRELRSDLIAAGERFGSESDTEVLVRSCRRHGVLPTLERLRGMFGFAYFDGREQALWLARDRFGEKPLYYAMWGGGLAFASELRALRTIPGFPTALDERGLDQLMRRSCIGGELSIFRSVRKVLPGSAIRIDLSAGPVHEDSIGLHRYWDAVGVATEQSTQPRVSDDEAAEQLDALLGESVMAATASDVPFGAFLSSGVDSTAVVSQLAQRSSTTVRTFTIGLRDGTRNEADDAREIARFLGTDHTELVLDGADALAMVNRLPLIYDEPFADSSQIPTALVSGLARQHVTVALTGDGADELFGGYPRYRVVPKMVRRLRRPPLVRRGAAGALELVPTRAWRALGSTLGRAQSRTGRLDERVDKLASMLRDPTYEHVFDLLTTSFWDRSPLVSSPDRRPRPLVGPTDPVRQMMLCDALTYLPDDILTKVDRAAMHVSLETRVPILSPEIYEFSCRLGSSSMIPETGPQKAVLRRVLSRRVPPHLWDRPKRGFSVPLGSWLRADLKPWVMDLLSVDALRWHGLLDEHLVSELVDDHMKGERDWSSRLWNIVMFQAWYEEWIG